MISLILAVSQNGVIGHDNGLPWPRLKADMRHFRTLTLGCPVVMGANTWRSLPHRLDGRTNIVVSRSGSGVEGADRVIGSIDEIAALPAEFGTKIFIIGGAALYHSTAALADAAHVTRVLRSYPGDTSVDLPDLLAGMRLVDSSGTPAQDGLPPLTFETYRRPCRFS